MPALQFKELPEDEKTTLNLQNSLTLIYKLLTFEDKATLETFQYLYGEKEGNRLWDFFKRRCCKNIYVMLSDKQFFTTEQRENLCVNVLKNELLYAPKE